MNGGPKSGLLPRAKGLQVLNNASDTSKIVFTQDQHAIIVPSSLDSVNVTYNATTYGVFSVCQRCFLMLMFAKIITQVS